MKIGDENTIVIVGAGLSGAVLAERYASKGEKVIVVEKRDHIAGNCFDYIAERGILKSKYGAHIFHTSHEDVWEYVNRFTTFRPYEHRVISFVNNQYVPIPANLDTYNAILGSNFQDEEGLRKWIDAQHPEIKKPKNSEESALKRIGSRIIYELMFKSYTYKQWEMFPKDLEPEVLERIPVRFDHNDRYFSDTYEGIPTDGYTKIVENMLDSPNIEVMLDTDYFKLDVTAKKIFFTGPIDRFFNNKFGQLQYRSIVFADEVLNVDSFQSNAVVNYPEYTPPYTRIVEHKKLYGVGEEGHTIITKEYTTWDGEPYYPVPNKKNRDLYEKYRKEAESRTDVVFVGRLANYKYFNMDAAIKNALDIFKEMEG